MLHLWRQFSRVSRHTLIFTRLYHIWFCYQRHACVSWSENLTQMLLNHLWFCDHWDFDPLLQTLRDVLRFPCINFLLAFCLYIIWFLNFSLVAEEQAKIFWYSRKFIQLDLFVDFVYALRILDLHKSQRDAEVVWRVQIVWRKSSDSLGLLLVERRTTTIYLVLLNAFCVH